MMSLELRAKIGNNAFLSATEYKVEKVRYQWECFTEEVISIKTKTDA